MHLTAQMKHRNKSKCTSDNLKSCLWGHIACYPSHKECHFELDKMKTLMYCRNGQHLTNCSHVACDFLFKCPDNYCIPHKYFCNNQWDCPFGEDELSCTTTVSCKGYLRCFGAVFCISLNNICDKVSDCPYSDDEVLCTVLQTPCPSECSCLAQAARCFHGCFHMAHLSHYLMVELSQTCSTYTPSSASGLLNAQLLVMRSNNITLFCSEDARPSPVFVLDISKNKVNRILPECFASFGFILHMNLSHNLISVVSFPPLPKLASLDLSDNHITNLKSLHLEKVKLIVILRNDLATIEPHLVLSKNSYFLKTSDFHLCCAVVEKNALCSADTKSPNHCADLLQSFYLLIHTWFTCFVGTTLNFASGIKEAVGLTKKKLAYGLIIFSTNMSDLLFVIYIVAIASVNAHYTGKFAIFESMWRKSVLCSILSITSLFSLTLSLFLCLLLSLTRFIAVSNPFSQAAKYRKVKVYILHGIWNSLVLSSVVFVAHHFSYGEHKSLPSLCFLLGSGEKVTLVSIVATSFFAFLQSSTCVVSLVFVVLCEKEIEREG